MGLPYEDKLQEMIEEEDAYFQPGVIVFDGPFPVRSHYVIFKGKKYTITGSGFIRSIEPFNQELCDLLFQALDVANDMYGPHHCMGIWDMIIQAAILVNGDEAGFSCWSYHNPESDTVLYDDPDFADEDEEDDAVDEPPAAEG